MPTTTQVFAKYKKNEVFVETGSNSGEGILAALQAGYREVHSIELSDKYYNHCKNRFADNPNVILYLGDSAYMLESIIQQINEPVTFWLDGHHSCGDSALGDYWAPLIQELDAIKKHPIKTHTILIDDMRCWHQYNPVHGFDTNDIIKKLNEINPSYTISYADGHEKDDVLIAHI